MIQANELRIGNLVHTIGTYVIVNSALIKAIEEYQKYGKLFKPIPITDEWLIRFGFEKLNTMMSGCNVFEKGQWRFAVKIKPEKEETFSLWNKNMSPPTWSFVRDIQYLHQLQNLYFALTGEELTLCQ